MRLKDFIKYAKILDVWEMNHFYYTKDKSIVVIGYCDTRPELSDKKIYHTNHKEYNYIKICWEMNRSMNEKFPRKGLKEIRKYMLKRAVRKIQ